MDCVVVLYADRLAESYTLSGGAWLPAARREGVEGFVPAAEYVYPGEDLHAAAYRGSEPFEWCMNVGNRTLICPSERFELPSDWDLNWSTLRVGVGGRFVYGLSNRGELLVWPPERWADTSAAFKAVPEEERWKMIWFGNPGIAGGVTLDGRLLVVLWPPEIY